MLVDNTDRLEPTLGGIVEEIDGDFKRDNNVKGIHMNRAKLKKRGRFAFRTNIATK